jgi:DNA-binding transcriptional MerR regulator
LLPGPEGAGPQSHYTESHAQRLRAIALLKDRYLPLREIRKQLSGLDDVAIQGLITDLAGPEAAADLVEPDASPPIQAPRAAALRSPSEPETLYDAAIDYIDSALSKRPVKYRAVRERGRAERSPQDAVAEPWRKIEVADGVELLVRDEIYRRRKDRIDWLIDWAKKVVD